MNKQEKQDLYELIQAEDKKKQVVKLILKYVDESKYNIYESELYTVLFPIEVNCSFFPFLTCHPDTVFDGIPSEIEEKKGILKSKTKGVGIGGDDRAGCFIIQQILKRKKSLFAYGIFGNEELGLIGSSDFILDDEFYNYLVDNISCFIGLDRRGSNQIVLYNTQSKEFEKLLKETLVKEYKYILTTGTMTDVLPLANDTSISACNFSVGYYNEHKEFETINLKDVEKALNMIDKNLPCELWQQQYRFSCRKIK